MKHARRRVERQGGFTLVEVLAALAITSVIIAATVGLTHNVALYFDRGTRGVAEGERLLLAALALGILVLSFTPVPIEIIPVTG